MKLPVKDIIEWDINNWSQLIPYWTPILNKIPKDSKILAVGERNGGLALWLALLGYNVVCTDRNGPTEYARKLHAKYGVSDKITYEDFDVVNTKWPPATYDVVIAKSVIGGLKADPKDRSTRTYEVQQKAVQNIHDLLKPGGYFFSAENLEGSSVISQLRKLKGKTQKWLYLKWKNLPELFAAFSIVDMKTFGVLPTLFSNKLLNDSNFLINKYMMQPLPHSSKYIVFAVLKK